MNQHPEKLSVSGASFKESLVLVSEDRGTNVKLISILSFIFFKGSKRKKKWPQYQSEALDQKILFLKTMSKLGIWEELAGWLKQ